jgi:hypothetical protein
LEHFGREMVLFFQKNMVSEREETIELLPVEAKEPDQPPSFESPEGSIVVVIRHQRTGRFLSMYTADGAELEAATQDFAEAARFVFEPVSFSVESEQTTTDDEWNDQGGW